MPENSNVRRIVHFPKQYAEGVYAQIEDELRYLVHTTDVIWDELETGGGRLIRAAPYLDLQVYILEILFTVPRDEVDLGQTFTVSTKVEEGEYGEIQSEVHLDAVLTSVRDTPEGSVASYQLDSV